MNFKKIFIYTLLISGLTSCTIDDFADDYSDPSKLASTTVGKQFTGMIMSNRQSVLPSYWDYFVIKRITSNRYTQAVGWVNVENQYVPGSAAVNDRWDNFYNFMAQYRELQKVYDGLTDEKKQENRVFMMAAATYFYDHTQQIVDLHGDIPWSEAGMLSINGGDYSKSYAGYDKASDIYSAMLDDLASFADEMGSLSINAATEAEFKTQDLVNNGDIDMWLKYINSLRLRMLTRVSGTPEFSARAKSEIASILSNPSQFPVVSDNESNVMWDIYSVGTVIGGNDFRSGLEDWDGNIAGKAILDHMVGNEDPRLTYVFQPGLEAEGEYMGLDPLMNPTEQNALVLTQTLSVYNFSTISRNQYFPGILITASEVHLMAAEYYLKEGQDAKAKSHYEEAINQSIRFYLYLRSISNNAESPVPVQPTDGSFRDYLAMDEIAWGAATGMDEKLSLIADQKWLHFNVVQSNENWHELRRLGKVELDFWVDNSNQQNLPPSRWMYPGSEQTYNMENYSVVQPQDKLTNTVFWDMN
ncbi:SusD/RagB family nutrient-binding outer membrane lipoprotein [Algoriphagus sp. D3-2-R+10]|uniref:SusD/RagB family nutrient-binding outer membrane lipoprotein n=1 Tax=Algoriphagus aurantiacus TaxID=3103948 RepID=UPI002B3842B7|nr:SusD/RagB family nutrient-binding outer membrane lipoprotein [Algoriphagus sp. D3-2-R+10]MEB2776275.1 SusD/RagB family nutrient-binding outer membrane lipoprotein [Algoriphagus sp. D3-2-R+10]